MSTFTFLAGAPVTGANPSLTSSASAAPGDLLVIVASSSTVFSATPPTGFTQLYRNTTAAPFLTVWYKIAAGASETVSVTNASTTTVATILTYGSPIFFQADAIAVGSAATSTAPLTQILTGGTRWPGELIISCYASVVNNPSATWTAPAATTQRVLSNDSSTLTGLLVVDETQAAAGASTGRQATLSRSVTWNTFAASFREFYSGPIATWVQI